MTDIAAHQGPATININRRDLEVMQSTAAATARRLARSLRLTDAERDDTEQDILVALLERWRYFDGSRGSSIGFAIRIARQASQAIADRMATAWDTQLLSFDEQGSGQDRAGNDALSLAELVGDEAQPDESALLAALSLRSFTATLSEELAGVVNAVFAADGNLPQAQQIASLSTSEFHRRLRELRYRLVSIELAPRAWLDRS